MRYDDLHERYGAHIAKRVQVELTPSEFRHVSITELPPYLELRAEAAHREYQQFLNNPLNEERHGKGKTRAEQMETSYRRWREAEDLTYLITIAEDVSATTRRAMVAAR